MTAARRGWNGLSDNDEETRQRTKIISEHSQYFAKKLSAETANTSANVTKGVALKSSGGTQGSTTGKKANLSSVDAFY